MENETFMILKIQEKLTVVWFFKMYTSWRNKVHIKLIIYFIISPKTNVTLSHITHHQHIAPTNEKWGLETRRDCTDTNFSSLFSFVRSSSEAWDTVEKSRFNRVNSTWTPNDSECSFQSGGNDSREKQTQFTSYTVFGGVIALAERGKEYEGMSRWWKPNIFFVVCTTIIDVVLGGF